MAIHAAAGVAEGSGTMIRICRFHTRLTRQALALLLCSILPAPLVQAQNSSTVPIKPSAPAIVRPYLPVTVPPPNVSNSPRLQDLVRGGALYLTAQDAIALALENNIDIAIARYNPIIAEWRVQRAQAGGALPGVPSAASQAGQVAAGQGVQGSQEAAGVRIPRAGAQQGQGANVTISQIGPVTQTLDPSFQESSAFSHTSTPQPNVVQSSVLNLISATRAHNASLQQGFLSGGSVTLRYTENYLGENAPTNVLNPSSAASMALSAQHNFLRGFGVAVNARTITVSKMNLNMSDLTFRTTVINVVAQVLNAYYNLSASYENLKSSRNTVDVARNLVANVERQVDVGTAAPPDLVTARAQLVTSEQALAAAEANLQQQEVQLKNMLSRTGTEDPLLRATRIVPVDRIAIAPKDDLPSIEEMVQTARRNRSDLAVEKANIEASQVSALGTRNGILPNLQGFATLTQSGLSGAPQTVIRRDGSIQRPDPYFVGDVGTALGQVFRRNFPSQRAGAAFQAPLRNRTAQADFAIDQLQLRQTELSTQKDLNQVEVDVMNNVFAMRQARAQYEAAVRNKALQQGLHRAEQRKYELGESTPYNVVLAQRDLISAEAAEVSALVAYSNARIALDRTLGTILDEYRISIDEARNGKVQRQSTPAPPPREQP
jgi:outer membrane protein